jgi:hypothetical protein
MGHPHHVLEAVILSSHTVSRTVHCQSGDGGHMLLQNSSEGFESGYWHSNVMAKLGLLSSTQDSQQLGQQKQGPQAAHLQYWYQQHPHICPPNHPQTHIQNFQHFNSFQ